MPMPKNEWEVILKCWPELIDQLVITNRFLDKLIEGGVLQPEDQQRIIVEPVANDKIEKLLNILKHKDATCRPYSKLKEVLLEQDSKFLVDYLDKAAADVSLKTNDEQISCEDCVDTSEGNLKKRLRSLLVQSFDNKTGLTCSLSEVEHVAKQVENDGIKFTWNVDQLRNFVIEVFIGVEYQKRKKKKNPFFRNIGLKVDQVSDVSTHMEEEGKPDTANSDETPTAGADGTTTMKDYIMTMSASQLGEFLRPRLKDVNLEEDIVDNMIAEDIDGQAFLLLEENHLKEYFSEMTLGKRLKFIAMKNQLEVESFVQPREDLVYSRTSTQDDTASEGEKNQMYPDSFRQFDTSVCVTDQYIRGRLVEVDGHSRGNMIVPRRHFICPQEEGTELCRKVAREVVIFASACMNDRTNGTLHAGISPSTTNSGQKGEIIGLQIDRGQCERLVQQYINESFYEEQLDVAERAISDIKFIQVTDQETSPKKVKKLYVVEVDVIPSAVLIGNNAFFVKTKLLGGRRKKRKQDLYRFISGELQPQTEDSMISFMNKKQNLTELRREQETKPPTQPAVNLRQKLLDLVTGGSDTIEDDIYPVLFTSPLDKYMDQEFMKENLTFIQHFDTSAVFDFDPESSDDGLYKFLDEEENQCYAVLTTDNFKQRDKKTHKEATSAHKAWIFNNGYSGLHKPGLQPFDWKQERSAGFKEALHFYHQNIPLDRGLAIIFLFSKNYEVLLEAAEEILLKFKDHWMVIAENEAIAHLWNSEMTRRNVLKKDSLEKRCVIGMPWSHINQTFMDIFQTQKVPSCYLPLSTGAFTELSERERNNLCGLEILSSRECDVIEDINDKDKLESIRRRVEEKFFRGGTAEWWNFWFGEDHVKKRQQHANLIQEVEKALKTPKADEVILVTLLHQPGAGGTTTSRQVLWDLRQQYKCFVVQRITDETAEQIASLRKFGEASNPKPPLILIDNYDEESVDRLLAELEDIARLSARRNEECTNVFCVLLHCVRRANLPQSHEGKQIHLRHDLSPQELSWFGKKYDDLQRMCDEHKGVDPKLLISFNMLKTNFSEDYVKRTVKELMNDIDDPKERKILRYLSFLNTYDIDFYAIPVSCFDPIMEVRTKKTVLMQTGLYRVEKRPRGWETTLGSSIRVLLNESSKRMVYGAKTSSIQIINSLLSREILATLLGPSKLSDIILELLGSEIFEFENANTDFLLGLINNLVKKRATLKDKRVEKFSPLILEIMQKEGEDKAAEVFVEVFKVTNVAMVAQQLARLYIHYRNWSEAEKYAAKATKLVQSNSFLWDTYAQVFEQQLKWKVANTIITKQCLLEVLELVKKAIEIFKKELTISETEKNAPYNYNGYLGEVRVVIKLFKALEKCHDQAEESDLHAFLVEPDFIPEAFSFLDEEHVEFVKVCGKTASMVIQKLEDELLQLKADTKHESLHTNYFFSLSDLLSVKEELFRFYGENTDKVPDNLNQEDQCEFRRRRVRRLGGTSLQGLLTLRLKNSDHSYLLRVYDLIMQNVTTQNCNAFDLTTVLNALVAMFMCEDEFVKTIPFSEIIGLSQKLIDQNQPDRPMLESFLYILLFNVPTPSRLKHGYDLCQSVTIRDTMKLWKEAFYTRYPKQKEEQKRFRKKDTTLFFLGRGEGMDEIVYQGQLVGSEDKMRINDDFWNTPRARQRLLRYEGTLLMDGCKILATFKSPGGNHYEIYIPTSLPMKKNMWQKKVYFVLGFSWVGPKAYDVTLDDPSKEEISSVASTSNSPQPQLQHHTGRDYGTQRLPINRGGQHWTRQWYPPRDVTRHENTASGVSGGPPRNVTRHKNTASGESGGPPRYVTRHENTASGESGGPPRYVTRHENTASGESGGPPRNVTRHENTASWESGGPPRYVTRHENTASGESGGPPRNVTRHENTASGESGGPPRNVTRHKNTASGESGGPPRNVTRHENTASWESGGPPRYVTRHENTASWESGGPPRYVTRHENRASGESGGPPRYVTRHENTASGESGGPPRYVTRHENTASGESGGPPRYVTRHENTASGESGGPPRYVTRHENTASGESGGPPRNVTRHENTASGESGGPPRNVTRHENTASGESGGPPRYVTRHENTASGESGGPPRYVTRHENTASGESGGPPRYVTRHENTASGESGGPPRYVTRHENTASGESGGPPRNVTRHKNTASGEISPKQRQPEKQTRDQ
ncbi:sterile alpha motif domain-containing protein 9-like isoform X3 [Haliotis rufescens]|uniref:sterile alpha motif domain-containing protein 9-like isoform X2 n=1 Tax=Haliotis rufescens TaxID=6454 RepID=UPI00201F681B|nr:sterile alpha motif domain-containing protein 9-like isoform X2 [Haliotis rufescens]XP_048249166.1 sterile alpha motif domain-containing protein 9-like isoform X3 [Haliotis rufescens]